LADTAPGRRCSSLGTGFGILADVQRSPEARRGYTAGLAGAALFGLSAPITSRLLAGSGTLLIAGLLYAGAAIALSIVRGLRGPSAGEAPIRRGDWPLLGAVTLFGGVVGPILLVVGLRRMSPDAASLLLNLEAPATMIFGVWLFREHLGRRGLAAAALVVAGAVVLTIGPAGVHPDPFGALAIAGACLAWGLDNNLSQRLSARDPIRIAQLKALGACVPVLLLALLLGEPVGPPVNLAAVLLVGATGYGLSITLDLHALRLLGAAHEAAVFATAPFVGAAFAIVVLGASLTVSMVVAAVVMAAGLALLLTAHHRHAHTHQPTHHEHRHTHGDGHHRHDHDPPVEGAHSHPHDHAPITHAHEHLPDAHHRHPH
jgi:drug/metabolite transporter (DMT)-like permease